MAKYKIEFDDQQELMNKISQLAKANRVRNKVLRDVADEKGMTYKNIDISVSYDNYIVGVDASIPGNEVMGSALEQVKGIWETEKATLLEEGVSAEMIELAFDK